jgi:hypothetical protein
MNKKSSIKQGNTGNRQKQKEHRTSGLLQMLIHSRLVIISKAMPTMINVVNKLW